MNVEIYIKMTPKEDIHISIYPIPVHPSPVMDKGLTAARNPKNGTEKRHKIRGIPVSRCHGSKERLICRG